MMKCEDVNTAHRKYFALNDDFEGSLDTLGDSREIGNDFEQDSESVRNTKIIYYVCFILITCFKLKEKVCKKTSLACWIPSPIVLQSYRNSAEIKN